MLRTATVAPMRTGLPIIRLGAQARNQRRLPSRARDRQRLRVWRKNPRCAECGVLLAYPMFELDHVVALADGGTLDDSNTQTLCYKCHGLKTAQENSRRAQPYASRGEVDAISDHRAFENLATPSCEPAPPRKFDGGIDDIW